MDRSGIMLYRRDGSRVPYTSEAYVELFTADRRVALSWLPGWVHVSTVHLPTDHNFALGGPPLIFETMVFGGPADGYVMRYATESAALRGHRRAVRLLRDFRKRSRRPLIHNGGRPRR